MQQCPCSLEEITQELPALPEWFVGSLRTDSGHLAEVINRRIFNLHSLLIYRNLYIVCLRQSAASYGMTDTMGRMHSDAQFAGSSSVPAHVEMMGFLGMGNNPMVGATVAVAVAVAQAM